MKVLFSSLCYVLLNLLYVLWVLFFFINLISIWRLGFWLDCVEEQCWELSVGFFCSFWRFIIIGWDNVRNIIGNVLLFKNRGFGSIEF